MDRRSSSGGPSPDVETKAVLVGAFVGAIAGIVLSGANVPLGGGIVLGAALGSTYVLAFRPNAGDPTDHVFRITAFALPAWVVFGLTLAPLVQGSMLLGSMSPAELIVGAGSWMAAGVVYAVGLLVSTRLLGLRSARPTNAPSIGDHAAASGSVNTDGSVSRIVICGGGFAGMYAAKRLEERFGPDPTVEIVLVSETNSLLFKPLLAEVAAGSLDPTDITTPLRTTLERTRVINARVRTVDPDEQRIHLADPPGTEGGEGSMDGRSIEYDQVVLSLGSTTDYKGLDDVEREAFSFTELDDAVTLRNHIITCLERADQEPDPQVRQRLLTVAVAGGGFAGAELAGALNDFMRDVAVHYPNVDESEIDIRLVHSKDRIMPELTDELADYAKERMADRGVSFDLGVRVESACPGEVDLSDGSTIEAETLVWTAGVRPHPMLETEVFPTTDWGAIEVDTHFRVTGHDNVWAVGDCAAMPRPNEDGYYPPTAEHAMRAAKVLADNVYADETGGELTVFDYTSPGSLVVVGYQTACAELFDVKFSGLFAWLIWRAVYLAKIPGADRKARVLVDWIAEVVFPREMARITTGEASTSSVGQSDDTPTGAADSDRGAAPSQSIEWTDGPAPSPDDDLDWLSGGDQAESTGAKSNESPSAVATETGSASGVPTEAGSASAVRRSPSTPRSLLAAGLTGIARRSGLTTAAQPDESASQPTDTESRTHPTERDDVDRQRESTARNTTTRDDAEPTEHDDEHVLSPGVAPDE